MDDSQLSVVGLPASACRAKALEPGQRGELALGVLTGSRSAAQAARDEGVSRKFVGAQVQLARQAVQQAFEPDSADSPGDADERVLFWIPVTGRLIRRLVLALILGCHSSYRGAVALLTEVLGIAISVGTIHNLVCAAAVSARRINERADLSGVRPRLPFRLSRGCCFRRDLPRLTTLLFDSPHPRFRNLETKRDDTSAFVRIACGKHLATKLGSVWIHETTSLRWPLIYRAYPDRARPPMEAL